jgi:hypothetical protein
MLDRERVLDNRVQMTRDQAQQCARALIYFHVRAMTDKHLGQADKDLADKAGSLSVTIDKALDPGPIV